MNKLKEELNLKIWNCCANYEDLPDTPSGNKSAKKSIKNLENWINQNYISKEENVKQRENMWQSGRKQTLEEILGLECLREENGENDEYGFRGFGLNNTQEQNARNSLRTEIKEEIKKL